MYDQQDNVEYPLRTPLRPAATGRGLPVPPLIPMVAVVSLLVGLGLGFRLSPDRSADATQPAANLTASPIFAGQPTWGGPDDSFQVAITIPPVDNPGLPPTGGLSMEQALAALDDSGFRDSSSVVISAQVTQFGAFGWDTSRPADEWVWVFVVKGNLGPMFRLGCNMSPTLLSPAPSTAATAAVAAPATPGEPDPCASTVTATATVLLDYMSGQMLEAQMFSQG